MPGPDIFLRHFLLRPVPATVAFGSVGPAAFAKGRGGRGAPFAGAHSVPSHRFLRPRSAGTCLRRAPSLFPWPRGATPPATFPFSCLLAPGTPETSGGGAAFLPSLILLPLSSPTRFVGRARKRISEACYTPDQGLCVKLAPRVDLHARPANIGVMNLEGHVQKCISVAVFVHAAVLQPGAMNKIALPGQFLYMTLQMKLSRGGGASKTT